MARARKEPPQPAPAPAGTAPAQPVLDTPPATADAPAPEQSVLVRSPQGAVVVVRESVARHRLNAGWHLV